MGPNEEGSEDPQRYQPHKSGSFFGNITSSKSERAEEAFEIYKQAATNFKLAKLWDDATKAYL